MEIKHKNKKGFTLIEMMLSIAIVTIVSGCLVSLVVGIKDSYINTYNSDDSVDYAMLYGKWLENSVLSTVQKSEGLAKGTSTWQVSGGKLTKTGIGGTETLDLNQMKVTPKGKSAPIDKWKITLEFDKSIDITKTKAGSTNGMIKYTIKVYDNYYDPKAPLKCTYSGGFLLPHFDNGTIKASPDGSSLTFTVS